MALVPAGTFTMGAAPMRPEEGPPRPVRMLAFWIDRTDVTNDDFARFVRATGYVTDAERPLDPKLYAGLAQDQLKPSGIVFVGAAQQGDDPSRWWRVVAGADWRHPLGPGSTLDGRGELPVVQVSWRDARAYARWLGRDLPTEAEWEYAARGGGGASRFIWGEKEFDPKHPQANVWQGVFPAIDTGEDGYRAQASPVGCFPPNRLGLWDMAGDVWQWTADVYEAGVPAQAAPAGRVAAWADAAPDAGDPGARVHVIKGGSFLCSPDYCYRYRPAAREGGPSDGGENHIGFRTVLRIPLTARSRVPASAG
jgi:formylglycine-generating enzyme required for sulfatase activity